MKNKIKSYGFWVSLSGAVVMLVEAIGRVVGFIPNADLINNVIMSIAGVLVVFGVVSIPGSDDSESKDDEGDNEHEEKE